MIVGIGGQFKQKIFNYGAFADEAAELERVFGIPGAP